MKQFYQYLLTTMAYGSAVLAPFTGCEDPNPKPSPPKVVGEWSMDANTMDKINRGISRAENDADSVGTINLTGRIILNTQNNNVDMPRAFATADASNGKLIINADNATVVAPDDQTIWAFSGWDAYKVNIGTPGPLVTREDYQLFVGAGQTNAQEIVYDITINVTESQARDFGFSRKILDQYSEGRINLEGATDSMYLDVRDLKQYTEIDPSGRISGVKGIAFIRGETKSNNNDTENVLDFGFGERSSRSGEAYRKSESWGVTPRLQFMGYWLTDDDLPQVVISPELVSDNNKLTEWKTGNEYTSGSYKGEYTLLGKPVLPIDVYADFMGIFGEGFVTTVMIRLDVDAYGIATYQIPELDNLLTQDVPMGGFNAAGNVGLVQVWLLEHGISIYNRPERMRHKDIVMVTSAEHTAKYYGDVTPVMPPIRMVTGLAR